MRHTTSFALSLGLVLLSVVVSPPEAPAELGPAGADVAWIDRTPVADDHTKVDPAGRSIVYLDALDETSPAELWSLAFSRDEPVRLSGAMRSGDRIDAYVLSPDGRWVAFTLASDGGPTRLYRTPVGGGPLIRVDDDRFPIAASAPFGFRADSAAIGFRSGPDRAARVVRIDGPLVNGFDHGDAPAWSEETAND